VIITLPWPDKRLLPNARVHWAAKAPVTKKARHDACYATYEAAGAGMRELRGRATKADKIELEVRFYPPDRRRRDDDGMVGSFKAYRDGIADALGLDDNKFRPHYFFEDAAKPGRIEVRFPWLIPGRSPCDSSCGALQRGRAGSVRKHLPSPDQSLPDKEAM
jgi:crossover junction endodeoxyribonuclease RusA